MLKKYYVVFAPCAIYLSFFYAFVPVAKSTHIQLDGFFFGLLCGAFVSALVFFPLYYVLKILNFDLDNKNTKSKIALIIFAAIALLFSVVFSFTHSNIPTVFWGDFAFN